ncbi:MAG: phage portal protein, partial [Nitrosospira sp.]|nr:phage portal protein [Nitrosospira sp.]
MSNGNQQAPITADISVEAYSAICRTIREQPKWREDSSVDCDYYDGSQLRSDVIQRLKEAGIPPQDSNLVKPTINAVLGLEARS